MLTVVLPVQYDGIDVIPRTVADEDRKDLRCPRAVGGTVGGLARHAAADVKFRFRNVPGADGHGPRDDGRRAGESGQEGTQRR
jgi:hypothetical protein